MTLPSVDVLLVLTALTVFVGLRTLTLVRSRRASSGRRVIVAAALRPRPAASRPAASRPAASRPAAARLPLPDQGEGQAALPTRRSLRGSRSGAQVTLSTLAAPTSAQLLPPPPRGRPSRRGERQSSSQRSAA